MIVRNIFCAALVAVCCVGGVQAQQPTQNIRGYISDQATSLPIEFATILLVQTQVGAVSDSAGQFVLRNVPVGRYDVLIRQIGYEPLLLKDILVSSAKEVVLHASLKESPEMLEEVTVTPRVSKELPLNSMAAVSAKMLSVEEAKRYAGGFDDPARLVSAFAGVSSNINNNSIIVRGNSPRALQWKLEGVEIPNPNHFADMAVFGGGGLTALSTQVLANSDFLSGAFPAEYNNALSGVFDIFMRQGNNAKTERTFQIGLVGADIAAEGPWKKNGKSSYLFNYRYSTLALLTPLLPENGSGIRYQDLSFKFNFPTRKLGTFSWWGLGLTDFSGQKAKENPQEWKYEEDRRRQDVRQYMGASGLTHRIAWNERMYAKTTLAATVSGLGMQADQADQSMIFSPEHSVHDRTWNIVLNSSVNTKINRRHTNKTGFVGTAILYDMSLKKAPTQGQPLRSIVDTQGGSMLWSAYSHSSIILNTKWILNAGINSQIFMLNGRSTLEPRIAFNYIWSEKRQFSIAYGLHSRLERIHYYFVNNPKFADPMINRDLGFSKAHHWVLGYQQRLSPVLNFKAEVYYQTLFEIPVVKDTAFSMINMQNDWFFDQPLHNTGTGRNYGIDLTFEKYLSQGYYFLLTGSFFQSFYTGGDDVERPTRYSRNMVLNVLGGKEWISGAQRQRIWNLNARISWQGGDRYSPINMAASRAAQKVIADERQAFSAQLSPSFSSHLTASYKINQHGRAHEWALKIINVNMFEEFYGFRYNQQTGQVEEFREAIFIPNLSYRIDF